MPERALVVGGAAATGRHIVAGLAARGYDVTVLHRGVHEPPELAACRHLHADPHFTEPVIEALGSSSFDVVILTYGRIERLAPVFAGRCGRLISIGGVPAYAGFIDPASRWPSGTALLAREDDPPLDPRKVAPPEAARFAARMLAAEQAVLDQHARGGYVATVFRYPRIYGPYNIVSHEWSLARRVADGRSFVLLPNGGLAAFTRCAAANAAHCVLLAIDCERAGGQVFNCGDDEQFALRQWTELVLDALGAKLEIIGMPPALNWIAGQFALYGGAMFDHALVSTAKARDILGYRDVVSPRVAIGESARWWSQHGTEATRGMVVRDRFDYAREDRVRDSLAALAAAWPRPTGEQQPAHSYPHPKVPSTGSDHHGR